MRNSILLMAGLLAAGTPALAQKKAPVKTAPRQRFNPGELNVEVGLTIASTPNIAFNGAVYKPDVNHTGIGGNLVLKYIFPGYSRLRVGIRAAASSLRVKGDAQVTYIGGGREDIVAKYANPLVQIGLQGHYEVPLTTTSVFRISPFAGYGYAWSEKTDGSPGRITAAPVGNTAGFNAGIDLTVKARIGRQVFLTLSSGYQRSWMRFTEGNSKAGFNIGHIPINIGLSTNL
jgi:hypothetical protein